MEKKNPCMTTGTMCSHKTKIEGNRVSSMHATLKHIYSISIRAYTMFSNNP